MSLTSLRVHYGLARRQFATRYIETRFHSRPPDNESDPQEAKR